MAVGEFQSILDIKIKCLYKPGFLSVSFNFRISSKCACRFPKRAQQVGNQTTLSRCDFDLCPLDFERLRYVGCLVIKDCTKIWAKSNNPRLSFGDLKI